MGHPLSSDPLDLAECVDAVLGTELDDRQDSVQRPLVRDQVVQLERRGRVAEADVVAHLVERDAAEARAPQPTKHCASASPAMQTYSASTRLTLG